MLIVCCNGFDETLNARMFVDDRCVALMRVAASACHEPAVRGESPGGTALCTAAASPVDARTTTLACYKPESVDQQGRCPSARYSVTHLPLASSCPIQY